MHLFMELVRTKVKVSVSNVSVTVRADTPQAKAKPPKLDC